MNKLFFIFLLSLMIQSSLFAQISWQELQMGSSAKKWQGKLSDISNPKALDEKKFMLNAKIYFFGLESPKVELSYYNDRLFSWKMFFEAKDWDKLKEILSTKIDTKGTIYEQKKEGYWYLESGKQFSVFTHNNEISLYYTDDRQKDFRWQDLFRGTVFYVLLSIVGLVILWFVLAWLWTSYCPECRSFSMEHVRRDTRIRTVNTGTFTEQLLGGGNVEMRFRYTDFYRCKKCGYETKYKYKSPKNN